MSLKQLCTDLKYRVLDALARCGIYLPGHPLRHFRVVKPGVLYRSSQPDERSLPLLKARYGIRTVINLRGREDAPAPYDVEAAWCKANNVDLVDIPMGQPGEGAERLGEFLEAATDPARHPILTHCEAGSIRTGFAVAGYLIAVEGWTYADAVRRVRKVRFRIEDPKYARYVGALKALEPQSKEIRSEDQAV